MGYEIKMIIGKTGLERDEYETDPAKPYEDGSGFAYKRDDKGEWIKTGRKEHYFQVYATLDLCKLGYQEDALNALIAESKEKASAQDKERFYFFYADDGNTQVSKDPYDSGMWPVPVKDVLAAMKKSHGGRKERYRRTDWAMALLAAMANDSEGIEVMFYGH